MSEEGYIIKVGIKPPNWDKLVELYDPSWSKVVVTYAPGIYSIAMPSRDVLAHEEVHIRQQGDDPDGWWERYYVDDEFRVEQEVEAYRTQFKYVRKYVSKDRNELFRYVSKLASDLSSPMYGSAISYDEALRRIR